MKKIFTILCAALVSASMWTTAAVRDLDGFIFLTEISFFEAIPADEIKVGDEFKVGDFKVAITDTENKMAVDGNNAYFGTANDYIKYDFRLKSGGKSLDGEKKNYMKIIVPEDGMLRLAVRSGNAADESRNLVLVQNGDTIYDAIVKDADGIDVAVSETKTIKVFPYVYVPVTGGEIIVGYPVNGLNFYSFAFAPSHQENDVDVELVEFIVPEEWEGDSTPFTDADLPGFIALTDEQVQSLTVPEDPQSIVICDFTEAGDIKMADYQDGVNQSIYSGSYVHGAIYTIATYGYKFYYLAPASGDEPEPEPEPQDVTVVFEYRGDTIEVPVTLPYTFRCNATGDGELDRIIQRLRGLSFGGHQDEYEYSLLIHDYDVLEGNDGSTYLKINRPVEWAFSACTENYYMYTDANKTTEEIFRPNLIAYIKTGEPAPLPVGDTIVWDYEFCEILTAYIYDYHFLHLGPNGRDGITFTYSGERDYDLESGAMSNVFLSRGAPGVFVSLVGKIAKVEIQCYQDMTGTAIGWVWDAANRTLTWEGTPTERVQLRPEEMTELRIPYDQITFFIAPTTNDTPTALSNNAVVTEKATKRIVNGQLLIIRDGKTYTVTGQEVK